MLNTICKDKRTEKVKSPSDIYSVLKRWKNRRQENFLTITLDGGHRIIKIHHITKGLVNRAMYHPRECFWPAIKDCAAAVVFAHNHPSGNESPSPEDDETTERLCMAGKILGINVLDHIIITKNDSYFSYRGYGRIKDDHALYELDRFADRVAAEKGE